VADQNDNDKTLVMSLKKHLPEKNNRGLAKAPEKKALSIPENTGLANVALDLNPIVQSAAPLIAVLAELKLPEVYCDVDKLRRKLTTLIKEFENSAKLKGIAAMTVLIARYVLCAALDEAVLSLPSGQQSTWASQSLLSTFHEDAGGGEKFFMIMDRMNQDPALNVDMLELIYVCLSLGFEGKYRVMDSGHEQLRTLRESLYQRIQQQRKKEPQPLADNCAKTNRLKRITLGIPFRQVLAIMVIVLIFIYGGFAAASYFVGQPVAKTLTSLALASNDVDKSNAKAQAKNQE
jgi:type VI secretion system protein ImpK